MSDSRADYILQKLQETGSVKVKQLSQELDCSEVTIRTDIQKLEKRGLLRRVHGGAVAEKEVIHLPITPGNIMKFAEEKKRIAEKAFQYIENGDSIILDDSSVNYYLARKIAAHPEKTLIVTTNSLICANVLANLSHITLFMIGGQIGGKLPAAMGELAYNMLAHFKADKAFVSAHGVNFDAGITSIATPQLQVKKAILNAVDRTYLLIDSSKFGGGYVLIVAPLSEVERIITDSNLSEENREKAMSCNTPFDIV